MDNVILRKLKACGRSYSLYFDGIIDSKHRNRAANNDFEEFWKLVEEYIGREKQLKNYNLGG